MGDRSLWLRHLSGMSEWGPEHVVGVEAWRAADRRRQHWRPPPRWEGHRRRLLPRSCTHRNPGSRSGRQAPDRSSEVPMDSCTEVRAGLLRSQSGHKESVCCRARLVLRHDIFRGHLPQRLQLAFPSGLDGVPFAVQGVHTRGGNASIQPLYRAGVEVHIRGPLAGQHGPTQPPRPTSTLQGCDESSQRPERRTPSRLPQQQGVHHDRQNRAEQSCLRHVFHFLDVQYCGGAVLQRDPIPRIHDVLVYCSLAPEVVLAADEQKCDCGAGPLHHIRQLHRATAVDDHGRRYGIASVLPHCRQHYLSTPRADD
mmetsp:Transcript_14560/g.42081  ORF Transcript_14560/g.42081 Transcript_14560/m.42081 type:complete len:311 (-) Transcript_14560:446-1378(-)